MATYHKFLLLLQCFISITAASAVAGIPAIIVFGDSTVDPGNNNQIPTAIRSDFRPYGRDFIDGRPTGRFCNGRLATDFIAEGLGLGPIVPAYLDPAYGIKDFATAVSFASAGSGLDNATAAVTSVIPLWKEAEYFKNYQKKLRAYLGLAKATQTVSEALYVISIGTNDYVENYFTLITGRFKQFTVDQYTDFLVGLAAGFVTDIYRLGARKILFTGLVPIGCMPLERTINSLHGRTCVEEYNDAARDFNVKIQAMVNDRCAALPGLRLRYNDLYGFVLGVFTNPSLHGFENVDRGCCGTGTYELAILCNERTPFTCPDADKYFFWDSFHPSQRAYHMIAQLTLKLIVAEFL